jgi:hypothetical protein
MRINGAQLATPLCRDTFVLMRSSGDSFISESNFVDYTGTFLVAAGSLDDAVAAIDRIAELDHRAARAHMERHFSAERMVDDYVHIYQRLVDQPSSLPNCRSPSNRHMRRRLIQQEGLPQP